MSLGFLKRFSHAATLRTGAQAFPHRVPGRRQQRLAVRGVCTQARPLRGDRHLSTTHGRPVRVQASALAQCWVVWFILRCEESWLVKLVTVVMQIPEAPAGPRSPCVFYEQRLFRKVSKGL